MWQPTKFCKYRVRVLWIHMAVQHQREQDPNVSCIELPLPAAISHRCSGGSAATCCTRLNGSQSRESAPRAHKSAAWLAWAAHFFSRSSTSLTRKLLPIAFQHRQQQGHGRQRSGEHHLVS